MRGWERKSKRVKSEKGEEEKKRILRKVYEGEGMERKRKEVEEKREGEKRKGLRIRERRNLKMRWRGLF